MDQPTAQQRDVYLRELERRSMDDFMVYNPTAEDFLIEWGHPPTYHRVPNKNKDMGFGKGKTELPRYLMEKYARDMKNKIVNELSEKFVADLTDSRMNKGQPFRDEFEKNSEALARVPKTNDPRLIEKIYPSLILGLVREWGKDGVEMKEGEKLDIKTPEETILEGMNKHYNPTEEYNPEITPVFEGPKQGPGGPARSKSNVLAGVAQ